MQTIRHKMADIKTDIVTCRVLVDECIQQFENVSITKNKDEQFFAKNDSLFQPRFLQFLIVYFRTNLITQLPVW